MFKFHFLLGNFVEKSYFRKYSNKLTKIISLAKKLHLPTVLKKTKAIPPQKGKYFDPSFLLKRLTHPFLKF